MLSVMVIFVDTNLMIDFLTAREPYYQASSEIINLCAKKEIIGYMAFHSISNLWYILRKVPEPKRRQWMRDICKCLQVVGASHDEVVKAIDMEEFKDFEDCLQDRCAEGIGANYIITRNVDDFSNSKIQAILPEIFLEQLKCSQNPAGGCGEGE